MKIRSEIRIENEKRWHEHLRKLKEHKGTLSSYCQAHGVSLSGVRYWQSKLEGKSPTEKVRQTGNKKVSPFIPLQVMPSEEVYAQEHRLPDPKWVAELIAHLGIAYGRQR